jgi:hypothetical protein
LRLPDIKVNRVLLCADCVQASKSEVRGKALCLTLKKEVGLCDQACRRVVAKPVGGSR